MNLIYIILVIIIGWFLYIYLKQKIIEYLKDQIDNKLSQKNIDMVLEIKQKTSEGDMFLMKKTDYENDLILMNEVFKRLWVKNLNNFWKLFDIYNNLVLYSVHRDSYLFTPSKDDYIIYDEIEKKMCKLLGDEYYDKYLKKKKNQEDRYNIFLEKLRKNRFNVKKK